VPGNTIGRATTHREVSRFHRLAVAWVFLLYGLAALAVGAFFALFFGGLGLAAVWESIGRGRPFDALANGSMAGGIATAFALVAAVFSIPNIAAGYGLLRRRAWARSLAFGLAVLNLFFAPIGTLFGAYAIYALISASDAPSVEANAPVTDDQLPNAGGWLIGAALFFVAGCGIAFASSYGVALLATPGAGSSAAFVCVALAMILSVVGVIRRLQRRTAMTNRDERAIVALIARTGGKTTILHAARVTGLSTDRCEAALDRLAGKGLLDVVALGETTAYRAL